MLVCMYLGVCIVSLRTCVCFGAITILRFVCVCVCARARECFCVKFLAFVYVLYLFSSKFPFRCALRCLAACVSVNSKLPTRIIIITIIIIK